jgi:hypothetical protein
MTIKDDENTLEWNSDAFRRESRQIKSCPQSTPHESHDWTNAIRYRCLGLQAPVGKDTTDHELLIKAAADYDRRMSTRWGRFLMWLLRKTT